MSGIIGNEGPRVILLNAKQGAVETIDLPFPLDMQYEDPWFEESIKDEDVDFIKRKRLLGFRLKNEYYWGPGLPESDFQHIRKILSWKHTVRFYPYRDIGIISTEADVYDIQPDRGRYGFYVEGKQLKKEKPDANLYGAITDVTGVF